MRSDAAKQPWTRPNDSLGPVFSKEEMAQSQRAYRDSKRSRWLFAVARTRLGRHLPGGPNRPRTGRKGWYRARLWHLSPGALWVLISALPLSAWAVTTAAFELWGVSVFEQGKFEGTAALSDGRLIRGAHLDSLPLEGVPVAYTSTVDARGRVFVGTGNAGAVYRLAQGKLQPFAKLDAGVVTAIVAADDRLFVGSMPTAHVHQVDAKGRVKPFAELPGTEQVWDLAYDADRKTLYAATGPEGRVFQINAQGKASVLYDSEAEHIMALALGSDGSVYAGTSDGARLYKLGQGSAQVVYDFPGDEIGAIHVAGGRIAVAANAFPALPAAGKPDAKRRKAPKLKPGKGEVWVVHENGRAERLHQVGDSHVTDVELEPSGAVFAALGARGRVLRVESNGAHGMWAEVDTGQVMALGLTTRTPHILASDSAALYLVSQASEPGVWTSEPQDAETRARWGELSVQSRGDVQWQTRSGNVDEADDSWSSWSRPTRGAGPVRSPPARYLQVRATLRGDDAQLRAIEALYLPENRPAHCHGVHIEPPKKKDAKATIDGVHLIPSARTLSWEVDNPDDDKLSFRLHFRRQGTERWLPMLRADEHLYKDEFEWETAHLPDGLYLVKLTCSDSPSNPGSYVLQTTELSPLLRVDNHAPEISIEQDGAKIRGHAQDTTSRIAALTVSVDGSPFLPLASLDDLLDQRREQFVWTLPSLDKGGHIVAVRATDVAGNARVEQLEIADP